MGGKLAVSYANLIKEMWFESAGRTAPSTLKQIIGKRVTKFSGFGQQDSCELINYVLDLMHEDLNRVVKKPYVELQDSEGRPDEDVSQEHWNAFLARNRSIIVDLMYGQLKSTVRCLTCQRISITFDPFLTLALPIARPFKLSLDFIPYEVGQQTKSIELQLSKDSRVKDMKKRVAEIMGIEAGAGTRLIACNYDRNQGRITSFYQ